MHCELLYFWRPNTIEENALCFFGQLPEAAFNEHCSSDIFSGAENMYFSTYTHSQNDVFPIRLNKMNIEIRDRDDLHNCFRVST